MKYEEICKNFINDEVLAFSPLGDGHINETFLIETGSSKYVLQRLHKSMNIENLKYNYELYSSVFDSSDWKYPKWLRSKDGSFFCPDENGDNWRMYKYISGDIITLPLSNDMLYEFGVGLARMHSIFGKIQGKPRAVFSHLHDLQFYYEKYSRIISENTAFDKYRDENIEKNIKVLNARFIDFTNDNQSIIHGDTKIANAIFNNGVMTGFLDFDTVMLGDINTDIADSIRSCCFIDGEFDQTAAESFVKGYLSVSPRVEEEVTKNWKKTLSKLCYELAIRYYIDAISGENHFKEKYPGYRLGKANNLLELCESVLGY